MFEGDNLVHHHMTLLCLWRRVEQRSGVTAGYGELVSSSGGYTGKLSHEPGVGNTTTAADD